MQQRFVGHFDYGFLGATLKDAPVDNEEAVIDQSVDQSPRFRKEGGQTRGAAHRLAVGLVDAHQVRHEGALQERLALGGVGGDAWRGVLASYGGSASRWVKKRSPRLEVDEGVYELHWYEHPGIGRVELKRKQVTQR